MRSALIVVLTLAMSVVFALPAAEAGALKPAQAAGFKQTGHFKQVSGFGSHGGPHMKVGDGNQNGGQQFPNGGQHMGPRPFPGNVPFKHPFGPRPFWPYRSPGVVYLAPPYFISSTYATPSYADADPGYAPAYAPPAAYGAYPSTSVAMAPPPPPTPAVIDYPQGRYELRGDGFWTPYSWEWVSKVPPPPTGPPPMAYGPPPGMAPPPGDRPAAAANQPESPRRGLYRWTDDQGVVNFTDNAEAIPEAYRSRAKRLTP